MKKVKVYIFCVRRFELGLFRRSAFSVTLALCVFASPISISLCVCVLVCVCGAVRCGAPVAHLLYN